MESLRQFQIILSFFFSLKLLFMFCYRSTDFEVHRNWLAITHSLPVDKWYYENTSIWTLDYPPFFAYFERILSNVAVAIDPRMVELSEKPYASWRTVVFQRLSVVVVDVVYVVASIACSKLVADQCSTIAARQKTMFFVMVICLITNVGLLLVDCIHFQYNSMMFGILLLSIAAAFKNQLLWSATLFAILLNFKHIFAYIAPAYVVFLLKNYCFSSTNYLNPKNIRFKNCVRLFGVLCLIFGLSFAPFINHLNQIVRRLFPFKRGLTHAYWAPNFWALYNFADFCANFAYKRFISSANPPPVPEYTSGMVNEFQHTVLPNVAPIACFVLTILFILPFCGIAVFTGNGARSFVKLLILCAFSSYMFGWHVHEKAILMCIVPLALLCSEFRYVKVFILLSTVGHVSLFPLFFTSFESPLKYLLVLLYFIFVSYGFKWVYQIPDAKFGRFPFLNILETLYIVGLVAVEIYCSAFHYILGFGDKFTFLPLMLISVYCSFGILYCWLYCCWLFLCDELSLDLKLYRMVWKRRQICLSAKLKLSNTDEWQNNIKGGLQGENEEQLKRIGGLDISTVVGDYHNAIVCIVVLEYPSLKEMYVDYEHVMVDVPYIPGLLAFREAPALIRIVEKLRRNRPDLFPQVLFIDGNGYLHPRKFGLACHIGVTIDVPTIGVAKNLHFVDILSKECLLELERFTTKETNKEVMQLCSEEGEVLGCAVRATKNYNNPIFVSVGNRIDIKTAVVLVKQCSKHRVVEPIRQADMISRKIVQETLS